MSGLIASQYWEKVPKHALTPKLRQALHFLLHALQVMPARIIHLTAPTRPPVVIYTDAATLPSGLRLGILVCESSTPYKCAVYDVPEEVIATWRLRKQYIGQGELLAGPLCAHLFADDLRDRAATWYIDNTSACSALIKGSSPTADSSALALVASLLLSSISCRLWVEYVHTAQNPADKLSRDGYKDKEVQRHLRSGAWKQHQPTVDWKAIAGVDLTAPFALLRRWGLSV